MRLVDVDDLIKNLMGFLPLTIRERIISFIDKQPTIDPVKHKEPLTLEELKQMDGQPIWVEAIDHDVFANEADDFDGWGFVRKSWVRVWDEKRADLIHIDYHFEDYGKEWRAYSMPVKHGKWGFLGVNGTVSGCFCGTCTACGVRSKYIVNVRICPNCGADMRGE